MVHSRSLRIGLFQKGIEDDLKAVDLVADPLSMKKSYGDKGVLFPLREFTLWEWEVLPSKEVIVMFWKAVILLILLIVLVFVLGKSAGQFAGMFDSVGGAVKALIPVLDRLIEIVKLFK